MRAALVPIGGDHRRDRGANLLRFADTGGAGDHDARRLIVEAMPHELRELAGDGAAYLGEPGSRQREGCGRQFERVQFEPAARMRGDRGELPC